MSAYGHGKPLRVAVKDRGLWRYGEGANVGKCDFCICINCTGRYCWMKSKERHCDFCWRTSNNPVLVCDGFERKPYKVYKVKKRFNREERLIEVLRSMQSSIEDLSERISNINESGDDDAN